jgi:signal transduction histidine kinase
MHQPAQHMSPTEPESSIEHVNPPLDMSKQRQLLKKKQQTYKENVWKAYAIAVISPLIAASLTVLLFRLTGLFDSYLLFFPAILLSSWMGSFTTGVTATIWSTILLTVFLSTLTQQTAVFSIPLLLQSCIFLLEGILLSVVIDRTKRNKRIQELELQEHEQNRLVMRLLEENAKARDEIRARDEFLSIASHELKTPLTSMLLKLQTVLHNVRNVSLANFSVENLLKMLESAEIQSKRLSKMINDLLNVSLITSGKLDLELEEVDLTRVVKDVTERFSERLEKDGITLQLDAHQPVLGMWDKLRIEQVVTNLISNAIKYGNGKPIAVRVVKHTNDVRLVVKDNGIGIKSTDQKLIFDRFVRAVTDQSYKGLGIGLYITYQIVRAHKGTIRVESEPEKGSTFTVVLPLK